jgi:hypothetical protein
MEHRDALLLKGGRGEELLALGSVARELRRDLVDAFFDGFFAFSRGHLT